MKSTKRILALALILALILSTFAGPILERGTIFAKENVAIRADDIFHADHSNTNATSNESDTAGVENSSDLKSHDAKVAPLEETNLSSNNDKEPKKNEAEKSSNSSTQKPNLKDLPSEVFAADIGTVSSAHDQCPGHSYWSTLKSTGGTFTGLKYVLTDDLILSGNLTISSGTVYICLNGYKLQGTGTDSVITINSGATLNLYDCQSKSDLAKHQHKYSIDADGKYNYTGTGGGTTTGGVITGVSTSYGGGVSSKGTLNMYGGTIAGNTATENGGGVRSSGTFTMSGGTISGNTAIHGGGVYSGSTFNMSGGEVSGNKSTERGGGVVINKGTFTMSGGTITGNTASSYNGGGVFVAMNQDDGGTFNMTAGTTLATRQQETVAEFM